MEAVFSKEQIAYLQSKPWWVACNMTPYIVRSAVFKQTLLISVSNMRQIWVTRVDRPTLQRQKEIYAKTLQVSGFVELLSLFQGILSNPETRALYQFYLKNDLLSFKIEKQIQVYPFQWKFDLIPIQCDIPQTICKDIVNPMFRTLQAQQRRFHIMKKKMEIIQKNLLKKMTQAQKNTYKSVLMEQQEDLKLLVSQAKNEQFICDLRLDNVSKFLFSKALQSRSSKLKQVPQKLKERAQKVEAKVSAYNEPKAEELMNQIQMRKQQEKQRKKKKALDFL